MIVALLAYWQRGRLATAFSRISAIGAPAVVAIEVSDLRCEIVETFGQATMTGTVRNISSEPLSLDMTAVWAMDDLKPMYHYGAVTPQPLLAQRSGRFEIKGTLPPPAKGICKVQSFTDKISGKPVGFR